MDSLSSVLPPNIIEHESDNDDSSDDAPAGDDFKCSATNIIKTLQVLKFTPAVKK
jgi:hypothetical protein